jgi:hypothetical protein
LRSSLFLTAFLLASFARADEPIENYVSGYLAGVGYSNHSYRLGATEAQLRLDLWQGLTWGIHIADTPLAIVETGTDGGKTTQWFNDLLVGGKWAPWEERTIWFWGEAHGLLGNTTYGMGGGFMAGAGGLWKETRLELGAGALWLQGDTGVTATGQLTHSFTPWLDLTLIGTFTHNAPFDSSNGAGGNHFAYGLGAKLGPWSDVTVNLRWLGGARSMALDRLGVVAENLPDTIHDTWSASVAFPVASGVFMTAGANVTLADETSGSTYVVGSGFLGIGSTY